ncbi:MAG: hypothetical protein OHK0019_20690 [Saprospiraceae bacterium]
MLEKGAAFALLIISITTLASWYFWFSGPTFTVTMSGSDCIMTLSNLPPLFSSNPSARYKVFFNTNDGHHYNVETVGNNPVSVVHRYATANQSYTPYVEFTAMEYDDDRDNPPAVLSAIVNPGANTGTPAAGLVLTDRILNIEAVRNIVPDHEITFILTYKNSCEAPISGTLEFKYPNVLDYHSGGVAIGYLGAKDAVSSSIPGMPVNITVNNMLPGEQRNFYLRFKTKPEPQVAVGQPLSPLPKLTFNMTGNTDPRNICGKPFTFELTSLNAIANAHDPNQKTIELKGLAGNQFLEYTIHFQNDGNKEVKNISITDELSPLLHCVTALTQSDFISFPLGTPTLIPSGDGVDNGVIKVDLLLAGDGLKGTHQPGYGRLFGENETKGYLKIKIPYDKNTCPGTLPSCGSIVNRATIRFGCNPPLETRLAYFNTDCDSSITDNPVPDTCSTTTIIIDADSSVGSQLLPPLPALDGYTDAQCVWYPVSGLNLTNAKNPTLTELKNKTYTLVASKSCERLIVHRIVRVPCTLAMSDPVITGNSSSGYKITVNAVGNTGPVEWHDCSSGSSFSYNNVSSGTYYFSVYEPSTGCWEEKWVSTMKITDDPNDCQANLKIEGGIAPYTYLWSYTEQGSLNYSTQPPPFGLSSKSNISVTVTDSSGNTAVAQISKSCKTMPPWGWIAAIGLAFLGILFYFLFKKP